MDYYIFRCQSPDTLGSLWRPEGWPPREFDTFDYV